MDERIRAWACPRCTACDGRGTTAPWKRPAGCGERNSVSENRATVLTLYGFISVSLMLVFYAFESRSPWFVLLFAVSCAMSSLYGFLQGAWPFGAVELILDVCRVEPLAAACCRSFTVGSIQMADHMTARIRTGIVPYLVVDDAPAGDRLSYPASLGVPICRIGWTDRDGKVMNARVMILACSLDDDQQHYSRRDLPAIDRHAVYLSCPIVDAAYARAVAFDGAAGDARPMSDQFWGDRCRLASHRPTASRTGWRRTRKI